MVEKQKPVTTPQLIQPTPQFVCISRSRMFKWLIVVTCLLLAVSAYSPFGNQQGWRQGGGHGHGNHGWHGGPTAPDGEPSSDGWRYPNDYSGGPLNSEDRATRFGGGGPSGVQELQGGRNTNAFEAVFQWRVIDYEYPTREDRKRAIDTK